LSKTSEVQSEDNRFTGRVIRCQSGFFFVQVPELPDLVTCQISGRLKIEATRAEQRNDAPRSDLVALNDFVTFERQADGSGSIVEVSERRNLISRIEPSAKTGTSAETQQIIIANADQSIFVFAAEKPRPNRRTLDRFLVTAEKAGITSIVICVNKIDLADRAATEAMFAIYTQIGYTVLYVSANTGENIEQLRGLLQVEGRVSVFTGPSGVGKSSLLNTIQTGLALTTGEVSLATTKGKHTTRFSQLLMLEGGGFVADTPGIRTIAPWDVEPQELDNYYIEFRPYIENCKFADCTHFHEPGCAVIAAVEAGQLDADRLDSYMRLREELEEQYIY
jgi:ribosome biogenesis GTPase / thiamine phosphate phosphatase